MGLGPRRALEVVTLELCEDSAHVLPCLGVGLGGGRASVFSQRWLG